MDNEQKKEFLKEVVYTIFHNKVVYRKEGVFDYMYLLKDDDRGISLETIDIDMLSVYQILVNNDTRSGEGFIEMEYKLKNGREELITSDLYDILSGLIDTHIVLNRDNIIDNLNL